MNQLRALHRTLEDFVLGLLLFSLALLFSTKIHPAFTLPKLAALRVGTLLLTLLWIYRVSRGEIRPVPKPVFYPAISLGVWWAFSTLFALNIPTALSGFHGRYNGLWSHETFLLLFLILSSMPPDVRRIERILKLFVAAMVPVSAYALIQFYGFDFLRWVGYEGRPASTIGNPVIMAALLGLASPFALNFMFLDQSKSKRLCWGLVFVVLLLAVLGTVSRGPLLGMAFSSAVVLFFNLKGNRIGFRKWIFLASAFLAALLAFVSFSQGGIKRFTQRPDFQRALSLRLVYYKAALDMVADHPVMGVGFENFRIIYPRYRPVEENRLITNTVPTMVHSGYLQSAVTNGAPALAIYLVFVSSVLVLISKTFRQLSDRNNRLLLISLVASISGYLIQDLSGWLEVPLTSSFWIILGLSVSFCGILEQRRAPREFNRGAHLVYSSLCALGMFILLVGTIREIQADHLFWKWRQLVATKAGSEMEADIRRALEIVKGDFYYEDTAGILYAKRFHQTGDVEAYQRGSELFERAHLHNPYDPDVLIHRLEIEADALRKGVKTTPSDVTERAADLLMTIDRRNPAVYEAIAKLRFAEGKISEATAFLERARFLSGAATGRER